MWRNVIHSWIETPQGSFGWWPGSGDKDNKPISPDPHDGDRSGDTVCEELELSPCSNDLSKVRQKIADYLNGKISVNKYGDPCNNPLTAYVCYDYAKEVFSAAESAGAGGCGK